MVAPKFSLDGRVAVVTIDSAFQSRSNEEVELIVSTSCYRYAMGWEPGAKEQKAHHGHGEHFSYVARTRKLKSQCANMGYNPDPAKVSFSCRIAASLRDLPDEERRETSLRALLIPANLIALLKEYGDMIPGFRERVGEDFARGHKEATGGIIQKVSSPFCFCL